MIVCVKANTIRQNIKEMKLWNEQAAYGCTGRNCQQSCRPQNAHGSKNPDMIFTTFYPCGGQSEANPKADDSHKVDPGPAVPEIWDIAFGLTACLDDAETER